MLPIHHITIATWDRHSVFADSGAARRAARRIVRVFGERLRASNVVDDHGHFAAAPSEPVAARRGARRSVK